jgi:DNA-binding beta-propeller fold protein YncE
MGILFYSKSHMLVADCYNHRIVEFDENMQFIKAFGSYGNFDGQFHYHFGIAVDVDDNIVVIDGSSDHIQIFGKEGNENKKLEKDRGLLNSIIHGVLFSDCIFLFEFGSKGLEN